jgi:serine/threonine-protein kinase RsbT
VSERLAVGSDQDVVRVRQLVRTIAVAVKLSLVDQTKLVTAASELARNTVKHGGGGYMDMQLLADGGRQGIRLHFVDEGPGIADLDQAMTDGWTSGGGLGLGLSGSRRLSNEFEIQSAPGEGTRVSITRWK